MEDFLIVIAVIFGLLNLILFFKIWGMTDNVKDIKDYLEGSNPKKKNNKSNKSEFNVNDNEQSDGYKCSSYGTGYKVGDKVTAKSYSGVMEVVDIYEDGSINCIDVESGEIVGVFNKKELTKKK